MKWWQQLIAGNQWAYDVVAAAARLQRQGRRQDAPRRLGRDDGGRLVRVRRARPGSPFHERVKVIDRVEHPPLRPGPAGRRLPVARLGGLNYSPGLVRPEDQLRLQRRGRDRRGADPAEADADAEAAEAPARRRLPRARERQLRRALQNWHDHGSISAIDVSTGRRVWKFKTPEPERGGVDARRAGSASPAAATACCARSTRNGQGPLDVPTRAARSRPGRRSSRRAARSTSPSPSGGTPDLVERRRRVSMLQVFPLGGFSQHAGDAERRRPVRTR